MPKAKSSIRSLSLPSDDTVLNSDERGTKAEGATSSSSVIGYKKPPIEYRFQKGRSGNPLGRPPKSLSANQGSGTKTLNSILHAELQRTHQSDVGNKDARRSNLQVLIETSLKAAIGGDPKSTQTLFLLISKVQAAEEKDRKRQVDAAFRYKIEKLEEIARCQDSGLRYNHIIPHPDHIDITFDGEVVVIGPRTFDEKRRWDHLANLRETLREQIKTIDARRKQKRSVEDDQALLIEKRRLSKKLTKINVVLPDFYTPGHVEKIYHAQYRNRNLQVLELDPRNLNDEEKLILRKAIHLASSGGKKDEPIEAFVPQNAYG